MIRKLSFFIFMGLLTHLVTYAQGDIEPLSRQASLESEAEKKDAEPEDDSYEMDLDAFVKHPVNLNTASEESLTPLHMLTVFQIRNLISYRKLLGPLLDIHELQAVPGWDLETIRNVLPYIQVSREESLYEAVKQKWKGGDETFLIRLGQVLEKSKGFEKPASAGASYYEGSAQKVFMRYSYNYKQLLAYGFSGEKDAGEPFLRSAQRYGFDFYSFHFFLRQTGLIRAIAIGDFTVSLGQGLTQWQSMSFTKTSQPLAIKREANVIRPYHSAGEFNFHRGIGITLQKGKWQATFFASSQRISTNLVSDTAGRDDLFSSFQQSGYHRTPSEIADRNNSRQFSYGGNIHFTTGHFQLGMNGIHFQFSRPFQKTDAPYNLYSLKGNHLTNTSIDYQYTMGNLHLFGEIAADHEIHTAMVHGALISLGENMDLSFLYRNISKAYQSLYADAFTENSQPNNEKGFYTGLVWRPASGWRADIYYDVFNFPWLKYRVDAPSRGKDFLFLVSYQPDKRVLFAILYKNETKMGNATADLNVIPPLETPEKQCWRMDMNCKVSSGIGFTGRTEYIRINSGAGGIQKGFLGMTAVSFRKPFLSGNLGITVFETDNYETRMYAYEPDLIYNFSLPVFYGKGTHYYINVHRDLGRRVPLAGNHIRVSAWFKWSQIFYRGVNSIGSGLDEINGNRKSECKIQVLMHWH